MMTDGGWMPMMGFGMVFVALFWVVVIAGIVYLIQRLMRWGVDIHGESSLEILKKRYARGEIGKDEFEEKRKDLL